MLNGYAAKIGSGVVNLPPPSAGQPLLRKAQGVKRQSTIQLPAAPALSRRRVQVAQQHRLNRQRVDEEQLSNWIATGAFAPHSGPTADERLGGLRRHLRQRNRCQLASIRN